MGLVLAHADTVLCTQVWAHSSPRGFSLALQGIQSKSQLLQEDNPLKLAAELVMRIWARIAATASEVVKGKPIV